MEPDRQNFLSFWTIFYPFTPPWTQKIKILKKWKKHLNILSLYKCVPEMTVIWCMVPEIWSAKDRSFCYFGTFFVLFTPLTTWKIKIFKIWKNTCRYHFTCVYHKRQSYDLWILRSRAWRTYFFIILDHFLPL